MTTSMKPYVVRQGDYLTKLAHRRGFSAAEVWDHPKNHELKELRKDMDILYPGDLLFLPEEGPPPLPLAGHAANAFETRIASVALELVFHAQGKELANEPYEVLGLPSAEAGTSAADGTVKLTVPLGIREIRVSFVERDVAYTVRVGDMDPIAELSGARMRLANLGHYRGLDPLGSEEDSHELTPRDRRAIAAFQAARGLPASGELDAGTRAALGDAHGS